MPDEEISRIFKDASPIPPEEIPRLFNMLLQAKKETELTKREMKKYDSIREVMIREITGKYSFYEFLFSRIFAERQEAINKDFQVIDEGMKRNNRDLIASGVAGLSQVVASSPLADIDKLRRMLGNAE
ncbi:MAG: hypothetical protein FWF26_04410 [Treponema sp.]|nr:hypothetical protein [Treponema sp.]